MDIADNIRDRIQTTREHFEALEEAHRALGLPSYLADLEMESLKMRMRDLERELQHESEQVNVEKLEIKVFPESLPSGAVPVRTLVGVLGGFQNLSDSVANTLFNQPSNRGPIPQEIIERNSWVLTSVKAGSFIAELTLDHEPQLELDDPPQKMIMNEIFNLFNASDEEDSLLEAISTLGGRTLKYYTEWSKLLKELDSPVNINWMTSKNPGTTDIVFDPDSADRIFKVLNEKLNSSEEEIAVSGIMTGVNVRTNSFEFLINPMERNSNTVSGRISKHIVSEAAGLLGKLCEVSLLKVTARSTAGREKVSWTLKEILVK